MQLRFLAQTAEVALQQPEALGDGGDLAVGALDLFAQEVDLAADLVEARLLGVEVVQGRRQVVRDHLELGADLAGASVGFLGGVDHGRADEHPFGRDERGGSMLGLLGRGLLDRGREVDVAQHRGDDAARGGFGLDLAEELALVL